MEAADLPTPDPASNGALGGAHSVRVGEPGLRDELVEYLESGGWAVELAGDDELRARWRRRRARSTDRINLRFSVAVWQAMHERVEVWLEPTAAEDDQADETAPLEPGASLSALSEELRTSLTSILGYLELFLGEEAGRLTPQQRSYLETVERNATRLGRAIGQIEALAWD